MPKTLQHLYNKNSNQNLHSFPQLYPDVEGGLILLHEIQKDEKARVSFAIMGVLILIFGSFSAVFLASMNKEHVLDRIEESHFERMRNIASLIHEEVETQAYYCGLSSVYTATQMLHDQKQIMPLFNETFNNYINDSFPRRENNLIIEVENFSAGIFFETLNTYDIIPTNEQENQTLKGKGKGVESKTIKNEKAGEFNETTSITYYTLSGEINYTVIDTSSSRFLRKSMHLERRVESAFPLLEGKLKALDAGSKGTSSPVPRTVKYVLTTLAQYRVLQGYGMGSLPAVALNLPEKGTSQIITTTDVELALNLALLLETARLYRTYDEDALRAIDDNFQDSGHDGRDKIGNTSMGELVRTYVNNGTIDATDIIALFLGIENKTINIEAIFAQALNAVADQFILKYLDYFHFMDYLDNVFYGVQVLAKAILAAGKAVGDFFGWIDDESSEERNLDRLKDWVRETLIEEAALSDTTVMHDTTAQINGTTYTITLKRTGECGHWEDADNDPSTPDEFVIHSWSTTMDYEIETQPGDYTVDFLEKDILREGVSDLWCDVDTSSDFYDQGFGVNLNEIYVTLRDVVKLIIAEVVNVMSGLENLDISIYKILTQPENINPKDNISMLEEVRCKVDGAIEAVKAYFSGEEGKDRVKNLIAQLQDGHAHAIGELKSFITKHFDEFADKNANIKLAEQRLAHDLILNAKVTKISQVNGGDHPDCAPDEPFSEFEVKMKFEASKIDDVMTEIDAYVIQAYEDVKNEELSVENNGKYGKPLHIIGGLQNIINATNNVIIDLMTTTAHDFGFISMACDMVKVVADDIIFDQDMVNTKFLQYTKLGVPFEFWEDEYGIDKEEGVDHEILYVDQEPNYLSRDEDLDIHVSNPKGTHYTTVADVDLTVGPVFGDFDLDYLEFFDGLNKSYRTRPFATSWDVSVKGELDLKTRTHSRLFLIDRTHDYTKANKTINLDISITVTVYSGWNLDGVNYELSNTLLGDVCDFLAKVWDYIVSVVGAVFDALTKLWESFMNLLTRLISYVAEIVKLIVDTIQFFVELLEDFIQFIMDTIIKDIIEAVADLIGDGLSITIFGLTFAINGNKEVATNQSADGDLLLVSTSGGILGLDLNFTLRFARYHTTEDDLPHYDVLLDGAVNIGDFNLELNVDPLMKINSHIVEGHGKSVSEEGSGWGLDFYVPDVEEYKEVKWCLSDLMELSIPIPFLGIKATIDAGFVIQYNEPKGDKIVINEFELNPEGDDNGSEWFEIYNPQEEDLGNWSISSAKGGIAGQNLSELYNVTDGEYSVYVLPEEILQNGESLNPFSKGDGLILMNETGVIMDETPVYKDPDEGDNRTWQRSYDGSMIWKFKEGTILEQNGEEKLDFKKQVLYALKTSFRMAFDEFLERDLSLDSVIEFVQDWIQNFIDMVLQLILDVVQKVYVFFDLKLEDVSGSAGGGFRISLGMDDEGLVILLRWLIDTIETFIYNIANPSNPQTYPSIPKSLPEHIFVRFEVYLEIGTPKVIKKISENPPADCRLSIAVSANIPALVSLLGWEWGDWEVIFGVYIAHFPSKAVSKVFGTSEDPNTYVDIWLFKARVYEIS